MWLLYAFLRFILPDAVNLKRFLAPLFDFTLGMTVVSFFSII